MRGINLTDERGSEPVLLGVDLGSTGRRSRIDRRVDKSLIYMGLKRCKPKSLDARDIGIQRNKKIKVRPEEKEMKLVWPG